MKSYQIHLIRHGMTNANVNGQYVGMTDLPLNAQGAEQLQELSEQCRYPGAAVFYSSPLKRCLQTCSILYPQINPILVPGLSECNFGEWEGKTAKELQRKEEFLYWLENFQQTAPPGGESGAEFAKRVCETFEKLVEGLLRTGITEAVLVTHGGVIMTILASYGLPRADFYDWIVGNGCGYSLRITPGLWMRDKVAEVYAKVPAENTEKMEGEFKYMLGIAREAADRAYGKKEKGQ